MRKAIVWFIAGFIAATAFSAHAEVMTMMDKVVQGEYDFTIGNDKLESKSIIVDGLAYVPARLAGETSGHIVRFDEVTGVRWIKKITTPKTTVLKSIEVLNGSIKRNQDAIGRNEEEIVRLKKLEQIPTVLMDIQTAENTIERQRKGIIDLNEQIAKLNQTLSDIAAQEAELANQ